MARRGKRTRHGPYQRREVIRKERGYEATVRQCCATNRSRPHADDCQRHPTKCRDKVAFPTRERAMARAAEHTRTSGGLMTQYRCGSCGQWHIGHPTPEDE